MTRDVITVAPEDSMLRAAQLMLQHGISGLPVVDAGGQLVGIITEGDFLRRAETLTEQRRASWLQFLTSTGRLADEYVLTHGRKVAELMSSNPRTVFEDTPLEEVVCIMEREHIKRVPVMRGTDLVGIVTRANLPRSSRLGRTAVGNGIPFVRGRGGRASRRGERGRAFPSRSGQTGTPPVA
jgi:CBS domain-containing protein